MAPRDLHDIARGLVSWDAWAGAGQRLMAAAVVMGGAFLLIQGLRLVFDHMRRRFVSGAPVIYIVEQLGSYAVLIVGVLVAIAALGVNLGSLTVFAGAIGVGLGLGLQGVVKEFVSGVALIFDRDIQIGDFIELDGDIRGEVVEIGPRATRLRTNDDLNVVIPNSSMMLSRVTNWTYSDASRRIHVLFAVADGSDTTVVRDVVLAAARALPFTLPDDDLHKTQVWLTGFSGAGLAFDLVVWPTAESSRHPRTLNAAYTWAVFEALEQAGIENANDQLELRLQSLFGRKGEDALQALNLVNRPVTRDARARGVPTNDAVTAMRIDTDRQRLQRAADATPRPRSPPSP